MTCCASVFHITWAPYKQRKCKRFQRKTRKGYFHLNSWRTCIVEAIFRGISGSLQHSSVWLLYFLICNGFPYTTATTFLYFSYYFSPWLLQQYLRQLLQQQLLLQFQYAKLTRHVLFKGTTTWFIKSMSNCQLGLHKLMRDSHKT